MSMADFIGQEIASSVKHSQVWYATHDGKGRPLPFMNRSFISFTYGGKKIEDFDLIATIDGDRLNRKAYAVFDDIVTTYDNLDGQHYWATHYKANEMDFTLSTDGIDQRQLENFKHWFRAGVDRELILAEHPNRAIMARVQEPPTINLLPFEKDVEIAISSDLRKTKTTLYKGDIQLSLVMDEPHWYSIVNILGKKTEVNDRWRYEDVWVDVVTGEDVSIFATSNSSQDEKNASQDALKIIYEDGIPVSSMIQKNMLLGNGIFANVENDETSKIWNPSESEIVWTDGEPSGVGARIAGEITQEEFTHNSRMVITTENYTQIIAEDGTWLFFDKRTEIDPVEGAELTTERFVSVTTEEPEEITLEGHEPFVSDYREYWPAKFDSKIAGPIIDISGNGIETLAPNTDGFFFYAGTAPSPTIITFTLTPQFDGYYVSEPCNSYTHTTSNKYNTFMIESVTQKTLQFTTPNLYTSYNKALQVFQNYVNSNNSWEKVREALRDTIRHPKVREYAIQILNAAQASASDQAAVSGVTYTTLQSNMKKFLVGSGDLQVAKPATFTFNSKTGEATGIFSYYPNGTTLSSDQKEDVGDMLKSNYIFIEDRNYPTAEGKIESWADTNDVTRSYSHRIRHDVTNGLTNIQILYKNMYL